MWQRFSQLLACYWQSVCVLFRGRQAHEYNLVSLRPKAAVPYRPPLGLHLACVAKLLYIQ